MTERDPDRLDPQTGAEPSVLDLDEPPRADPVAPPTAPPTEPAAAGRTSGTIPRGLVGAGVATPRVKPPIPWRRYLILGAVGVVLVVIAVVAVTSLLPRWWAGSVGRQAAGTISGGIGWGIFYGFVFTFLPLLVASLAFVRRWKSVATRLIFIVTGIVLAGPNLITLGIVVGTSEAAHAGERTLYVQAPGFRWATFIAALVALLLAALVWVLSTVRRRAVAELKRLRAEHDAHAEITDADDRAGRRAVKAEANAARERERVRR